MEPAEIKAVIDQYLNLIENGEPSIKQNEEALERLLDSLALAQHKVCYKFDEKEYPDAPKRNQTALRKKIEMLFPNFGNYNVPNNMIKEIATTDILVGDAIDDILSIADELYDVAWCWQNTSQDDALWHFQNNYSTHWKQHLRWLQVYLLSIYYEIGET